jgi:HlyD family secretion protein
MVVEVMISPAQIDHVHTGLDARVHLPGANRATTPDLPGVVVYVATDRSENVETKQVYYLATVAFDRAAPARAGIDLKSGMPAEVHIATGSRTLLSYLLRPLRDQFARAFRDG